MAYLILSLGICERLVVALTIRRDVDEETHRIELPLLAVRDLER